jgi:hypothetical protein
MANVAYIGKDRTTVSALAEYLGPADVRSVEGSDVIVTLPGGAAVRVALAFAFPYAPAPGDVLLVIGKDEAHYAIGVLQGSGQTTLTFPGNVELRAEGGALRLWGEKGVEILGPALGVQVDKIQVIAGAVTQKLGSLVQRVQALLSVQARQMHTVVEESAVTQARSATVLTEETMTINGKEVHLG